MNDHSLFVKPDCPAPSMRAGLVGVHGDWPESGGFAVPDRPLPHSHGSVADPQAARIAPTAYARPDRLVPSGFTQRHPADAMEVRVRDFVNRDQWTARRSVDAPPVQQQENRSTP